MPRSAIVRCVALATLIVLSLAPCASGEDFGDVLRTHIRRVQARGNAKAAAYGSGVLAKYYYVVNQRAAAANQHAVTVASLRQLPPADRLTVARDIINTGYGPPPDYSELSVWIQLAWCEQIAPFEADYAQLAFDAAVALDHLPSAAGSMFQKAAIEWSTNQFSAAMPDFIRYGELVEPELITDPFSNRIEVIWAAFLEKDAARRYARFMHNTADSRHQALCAEADCRARAWTMTEKVKSRLFRRQLARSAIEALPPNEQAHVRELLATYLAAKEQHSAALMRGRAAPSANTDAAALARAIEQYIPGYRILAGDATSAADVQRLLRRDETFVSYLFTDNARAVYATVVRSDEPARTVKLPGTTWEVFRAIEELRAALERQETLLDVEPRTRELARLLIEPLHLRPGRLIIAADQNLSALAFDILPWGDGLLLDAFETTFVPSASVFAWMRTRPTSEPAPTQYLGVSDAGDDVSGRIDRATDEVTTVARLFGTKNVLPDPTRDALLQFRRAHPRVRYLHLAMHAAPAQQDDTFGLVIRDHNGGADRLTAEDIVTHLPADADVVYIASCQSAPPVDTYAGFNAKLPAPGPCVCSYGESLSNVTAAFIANGTRHLVLTQYLIRDTPETVRVAELFFAAIRAGASPSTALRRVKRTMQHDTPVAAWAGFMVVGD